MFLIIHASHRHGYHWAVAKRLEKALLEKEIKVEIIDLSDADIAYCCGTQVCQEADCVHNDCFTKGYQQMLLQADGVYVVTPTYFNMPPAKLKNFIDRTNAILPHMEEKEQPPIFGAWVSGEADMDSIGCNLKLLCDYADIMSWERKDELNHTVVLEENTVVDDVRICEIANLVCVSF